MARYDFAIPYDPGKDTEADIVDRILYNIFIKRIKGHKPVICFLGADSGEGKSFTYLKLAEILLKVQGIDIREYIHDINVYTPLEYPQKLRSLLFDKRLKKVNMIGIHEARDAINAKDYTSFLARSIADINAQSRSVKPMMIFIVSQFIRDITTDVRYTLTYYCKIYRPLGQCAQLRIYRMWKDDRDLEKPKLKKRPIRGYLVYPNGKYKLFKPSYFDIRRPERDITDAFEQKDREAKAAVIQRKMEALIRDIKKKNNVDNTKIKTMVDWYVKHPDSLRLIGRRLKRGFKLNPHFKQMHDLDVQETKDFKDMLDERLKEIGYVAHEEKDTGET